MSLNLTDGIVRILGSDQSTVGTGFVIREDGLIVTCAHVVIDAKAGPGGTVFLVFLASRVKEIRTAIVEAEYWRDPDKGEDIAILRLQGNLPKEVVPLPLGSSMHSGDHNFSTFGFPELNALEGMRGGGKVLGIMLQEGFSVLQLRSEEVTQGFSGAPIWDNTSQVVIGMVTSSMKNRKVKIASQAFTFPSDQNWRFLYTAFATPTETLREAYPELRVSSECPYRQLVAFTEADARFFYGRDIFIETLLKRLHDSPRFLAVFGPSGSGKSSVVRAGLFPKLQEGVMLGSANWEINIIRPADDPFRLLVETSPVNSDNLTQRVGTWLEQHPEPTNRFVLVVDQFEELLASKDFESSIFITRLTDLLDRSPRVTLVIVMRDDFYSQYVGQETLRKWLDNSNGAVNIPQALTRSELEAIIREPAKLANISIQDGLVDLLVKDAIGEGKQEARSTILPLLEFTLTRLWEKRQNETLTLDAYNNMHGIKDEFTSWANITYDNLEAELPLEHRHLVQRIFTDLVYIGDEHLQLPNSRQRRSLTSLCRNESELKPIQEIINKLVNARLLVRMLVGNEEMVEIIHDVLLNEWEYLKSWIKENRAFLTWHQKLEGRVQEWAATDVEHPAKRDKYKLFGGRDLVEAEGWQKERKADLNQEELGFISAGRRAVNFRQRITTGALSTGFTILLIFSIITISLNQLISAQNTKLVSQNNELGSESIAGKARASLTNNQIDQALLLSLVALQRNDVFETRDALLSSLEYSPYLDTVLQNGNDSSAGLPFSVAFCQDRKTLMLASNLKVTLWDITERKERFQLTLKEPIFAAALNPNCTTVVTKGVRGELTIWNTSTGNRLSQWPMSTSTATPNASEGMTFSPDSRYLASADCVDQDCQKGQIILWNASTATVAARLPVDFPPNRLNLVFNPNSTLLAMTECDTGLCDQSQFLVWDIASRSRIFSSRLSFGMGSGSFTSLAFSPDGKSVVVGGCPDADCKSGLLTWWDVATRKFVSGRLSAGGEIRALAFSPDGQTLMLGSGQLQASELQSLDTASLAFNDLPFSGHSGVIASIAFSPDGKYFATTGYDNKLILWRLTPYTSLSLLRGIGIDGSANTAFSPDSKELATAGTYTGGIVLWDIKTSSIRTKIEGASDVGSLAFSPDGKTIAAGGYDGRIVLWDVITHRPASLLKVHNALVRSLTFSSDGRYLVSMGFDSKTVLWDVATQSPLHEFSTDCACGAAFFPNGQTLAVSDDTTNITLWDASKNAFITRLSNSKYAAIDTAISPNGKLLASLDTNGGITLWDIQKRQQVKYLPVGQSSFSAINTSLSFSPDGRILLSSSGRTITLWDWAKGELFVRPLHDEGDIWNAAFSPDGQLLASSDFLGPVTIRYATLAAWQRQACQIAHRNLTAAEWRLFIPDNEPYQRVCAFTQESTSSLL